MVSHFCASFCSIEWRTRDPTCTTVNFSTGSCNKNRGISSPNSRSSELTIQNTKKKSESSGKPFPTKFCLKFRRRQTKTKTQLYGGGLLVLCSRRRQDLKLVEGPVAAGWVACSELARTRQNTTKPSPAPLSLPLIQKPYDPAVHDPWHAGGDPTAPPSTRPPSKQDPDPGRPD